MVRNARATLARTLESALSQTYRPLDVLVIDGASGDGTVDLLERYGDRVRWISEPDGGIYDAMNKALDRIDDPDAYVFFLNADDRFVDDAAVERIVRGGGGADFLYCRMERRDDELDFRDVVGRAITRRDLLFQNLCPHQAIFCRRNVFDRVGRFRTEHRIAADYEWVLRVFEHADITRRFVSEVAASMAAGGLSQRKYVELIHERWTIVRRRFNAADLALFTLYVPFGEYLRFAAQRTLRAVGLLNAARRLKAVLRARVARNAGWLGAESVLRLALGLPLTIWITRYLGPQDFGALSYAIAFAGLLAPMAALGLDRIAIREIVKTPVRANSILGSVFVLKLAAGAVTFIATLILIALLRPNDPLVRQMVSVVAAAALFKAFDVVDLWYQSRIASKGPALGRSTAAVAAAAGRVVLLLARAPVVAFAWVYLGEAIVAAVGLVLLYVTRGGSFRAWRAQGRAAAALLKDAWPIALASGLVTIYMRIDQVMLGHLVGERDVGIYAAAVRIVEAVYFIPVAVTASAFPAIVAARSGGEAAFLGRLERLYRGLALAGYAVAIPTTLLAWWIVPFLFGEAYREASPLLAVLVWSVLFTNLGVARSAFLMAMNWTKPYLLTVALGALVNVALNALWIPRWGSMGAVLASCTAYWLAAHGSCFLYGPLVPTGRMITRSLLRPGI